MADINADIIINGNRENIGFGIVLEGLHEDGYTLSGEITPTSSPVATEDKLFYIAGQQGTYTNFGGITVAEGEIAFVYRKNNAWVKVSKTFASVTQGEKADTAYQKPDGGIPKTDMESAVQTSLGKADTAIQSVSVGTTTTGEEWTSASVTNSGTATNPVLNFTIPRGVSAVNPFKGWWQDFESLKAALTAKAGDFAYVKSQSSGGEGQNEGQEGGQGERDSEAAPAKIYVYDASAANDNYWADSGNYADTSNTQTFESGEEVTAVSIDSTHLDNPPEGSLPKAQEVAAKLRSLHYISGGLNGEETKANYTRSEQHQLVTGVSQTIGGTTYNAGDYIPQTDPYYTTEINISGWDCIKFRGLYQKTYGNIKTGFAFGHYSADDQERFRWVCDHAEKWSESSDTDTYTQGDYEINIQDVAPAATHFRTAVRIYGMTHESDFYILLRKGDTVIDVTRDLVEDAVEEIEGEISEVDEKIAKLEDNTQGFDFVKVSPEYAPTNHQAVMGVDGRFFGEDYSAGDIITGLSNGAYSTEVGIDPGQFDRVRFRGMIVKEGSTSDMLKMGYAFGYYSGGAWHTVESGHWLNSSETSSYTGKEYVVDVPQNQGVTHFRVTCGYYTNVPVNGFYIYFEKGKTIKQYIDDEFNERQTHPRQELVGKRYCNMSSSTFSSFTWHKNLVESLGMAYNNVGMGGAAHRCYPSTIFSLDYQNPDTSQAPVANRVILNQVANILTQYFNNAYYPHFIVSCCVLNDCSPSSVSLNQIGTAAEANNVDFSDTPIISALFDCASASDVATNFNAFFIGNAGNYSSMVCFRLAMELLSYYLPKTQIIVSSCQKIGSPSFNYYAIDQFNVEQEKMCEILSIPYIRLNSEVGINSRNLSTWLGDDSLHPNNAGQMLYTNYFREQLLQRLVVRDNIP